MSNKLKLARMVANNINSRHDQLISAAGTDTSHKWLSLDQAERLIDLTVHEAVSILMLHGYDDAANCLSQQFEEQT